MQSAARRLRVLGGQVAPSTSAQEVEMMSQLPCTGTQPSSSYASVTGEPSSYARVHGQVPRVPAQWRRIHSVAKEDLQDVKYEKAVGEGIAKVGAYDCISHGVTYMAPGVSPAACPIPAAGLPRIKSLLRRPPPP